MSETEKKLINFVHSADDPAEALIIACRVIIDFLKETQHED